MNIVFLDRDGVINKFPGRKKYVTRVKDFKFLPGAVEAVARLTKKKYSIFVISNQAGVSKGVYSMDKLKQINQKMLSGIRKKGGRIKRVFYCIHHPGEQCGCRKPQIGSIKKALKLMNKTIRHAKHTFFVGDAQSDIEAGKNAGCKTILVLSGRVRRKEAASWKIKPDYIVKNLLEGVKIIEHENSTYPRLGRRWPHKSRRSGL